MQRQQKPIPKNSFTASWIANNFLDPELQDRFERFGHFRRWPKGASPDLRQGGLERRNSTFIFLFGLAQASCICSLDAIYLIVIFANA
jgi:hypothetical protein